MTLISAHFEQLYFANCNLEKPLIYNSKIIIPTRQLGLLPDHPLTAVPAVARYSSNNE